MRVGVILDFDGTLVTSDVGDAICDAFAPASWHEAAARLYAGAIDIGAMQREVWPLVQAPGHQILDFVRRTARFRDGWRELLALRSEQVTLCVASGGFDFYVHELLGPIGAELEVFCNRGVLRGGRVLIDFPHPELACTRCALCKGRVAERLRRRGAIDLLVGVGDGISDRCMAGAVDRLFARGELAEWLTAQGHRFERYDADLFPLVNLLRELTGAPAQVAVSPLPLPLPLPSPSPSPSPSPRREELRWGAPAPAPSPPAAASAPAARVEGEAARPNRRRRRRRKPGTAPSF